MRAGRRPTHELGSRYRPRDPRAARDAQQDFLNRADDLWRRAQHAGEPRGPRLPRDAARAQRGGRPARRAFRPGNRRIDRAAVGVCAEELLLPGPAQGLPDIAVRAANRLRRYRRNHRRGRRTARHPRDPSPSRGGRRQIAARELRRPIRHRPEPSRHAVARDRVRTGAALRARGGRLHAPGARAGTLSRRIRRQHAGGLVPLRRQRVAAPQGRRGARHAHRDQEPELVPLHRARNQSRDRAPGGYPR